jgi:hypothetical protein
VLKSPLKRLPSKQYTAISITKTFQVVGNLEVRNYADSKISAT